MTMKPAAIELSNLTVSFGREDQKVTAIDALDLTVQTGQVFGFIGPNGAGKTTTMMVLLGFTPPTSGSATIFGTDVGHAIARSRIGFLPEHPTAYRFLTGREMLTLTARLFRLPRQTCQTRVAQLLERMDLQDAAHRRVATYSRGMLQRLCLAISLVNDPDLIILDEPTNGLDPLGRHAVREQIQQLRDQGKTIFLSSHELSEIETVCDTIAILAGGKLIETGSVAEICPPGTNLEKHFLTRIGAQP
jgi:ABC-2 type transport system ATP-binding protein